MSHPTRPRDNIRDSDGLMKVSLVLLLYFTTISQLQCLCINTYFNGSCLSGKVDNSSTNSLLMISSCSCFLPLDKPTSNVKIESILLKCMHTSAYYNYYLPVFGLLSRSTMNIVAGVTPVSMKRGQSTSKSCKSLRLLLCLFFAAETGSDPNLF